MRETGKEKNCNRPAAPPASAAPPAAKSGRGHPPKGKYSKRTMLLRKIHVLAKQKLEAEGFAGDVHKALKEIARANSFPKRSLAEFRVDELIRLCNVLEGKEKKYRSPWEKFGIKSEPQAQAAGLAGRIGSKIDGIARAEDLQLIQAYADKLGWDRKRLEGWIRKRTGKCKTLQEIRSTGEANKILWPMKSMLRRKSK